MNRTQKKKESITNTPRSYDDAELWETGRLGASERHVRVVSREKTKAIHQSLGLEPVTVRLQRELIDKLKVIAKKEKLGYLPLIRHILMRYVREITGQGRSKRHKNS